MQHRYNCRQQGVPQLVFVAMATAEPWTHAIPHGINATVTQLQQSEKQPNSLLSKDIFINITFYAYTCSDEQRASNSSFMLSIIKSGVKSNFYADSRVSTPVQTKPLEVPPLIAHFMSVSILSPNNTALDRSKLSLF